MSYGALNQSGKGSEAEHGSWTTRAGCCFARSGAAPFARIRAVRASGISVSAGGLPARSAGRSYRSHYPGHIEAPATHIEVAEETCEKQWADYWSDRDGRTEGVPGTTEEAWLSCAPKAACQRSTLTMSLIACSSPSLPRPTIFLSLLGNAPWGV